jgi:hypothetical protein
MVGDAVVTGASDVSQTVTTGVQLSLVRNRNATRGLI